MSRDGAPHRRQVPSPETITVNTHLVDQMRELHSRISDGIHVRLLWHQEDDRVAVVVDDAKTGDVFAIEVREDERALDVFHHPYAYAAFRDIETRASSHVAA
jgi:hypothetical protein